ncbi:hypothetical protein Ciccas_007183, partial [Cichlidogyrus casuarinus]
MKKGSADVKYYQNLVGLYRAYITPITFLIGIPGNILIIIAFFKLQRRARCRFNLYVIWISVANLCDLIFNSLMGDFFGRGINYITGGKDMKLDELNELACKFVTLTTQMSTFMASNLLVLFTFDRLITIYSPMKARGDLHIKKTYLLLVLLHSLGFMLFSPHFQFT